MSNAHTGVREFKIITKAYAANSGGAEVIVAENGLVRVNGVPVSFSKREHALLLLLAQAKGLIRTPRMLLDEHWNDKPEPEMKIFDVYLSQFRKKLAKVHPDAANVIKSEWGRGYAFGDPATLPVLPPPDFPANTDRWTIARKAFVIDAVRDCQVTLEEVFGFYPNLSAAEFLEWSDLYDRYGHPGLRTTRTQLYIQTAA